MSGRALRLGCIDVGVVSSNWILLVFPAYSGCAAAGGSGRSTDPNLWSNSSSMLVGLSKSVDLCAMTADYRIWLVSAISQQDSKVPTSLSVSEMTNSVLEKAESISLTV